MKRLISYAIVIACFWHFFYRGEPLPAGSLLMGALWLLYREARQLLAELAAMPGRPSRRAPRVFIDIE